MGKNKPFKAYHQHQLDLFPLSLDSMISADHPVRLVNQIIDNIDISSLVAHYSDSGCSSYHPRMMLKVMTYAYMRNIFSSRKIELALYENVQMMWLSGNQKPDHNTINRFRSGRLKGAFKSIFTQVVSLLAEAGHLSINKLYTDGTKIEANANRYTVVWSKSIENYQNNIKNNLEQLWKYAESIAKSELSDPDPDGFDPLQPEKIAQTIDQISAAINNKPIDEKVKKKLARAKKHWPSNAQKYIDQQKKLGQRNSYSRTDEAATFMRMKEDHLNQGQLKPAYNLQVSANNQFIVHYSIHQNANDSVTLKPHLDGYHLAYDQYPEWICADAGYGSDENYNFLTEQQTQAYIKYSSYDQEQKKTKKKAKPFASAQLYFNAAQNCFYCPMGQKMQHIGQYTRTTKTGYTQTFDRYQAKNCQACPIRSLCHKSKSNRIVEVNHQLIQHKQRARERLASDLGKQLKKDRGWQIETVFGNIKHNKNFRRFYLRGLEKVEIEIGLVALAHNLSKAAA